MTTIKTIATTAQHRSMRASHATTAYLAHRAGVVHAKGPRHSAERAIRRGLGVEFTRVRLPFGDGRDRKFLAYACTPAGIRAMAEQCRGVGRQDTAEVYERVADEIEAGTLTVEDVEEVRPAERKQEHNAKAAARRCHLEGEAMPEARMIAGRAYCDQISAALFIGAVTGHFRRSVRKLPPSVLANDTLDGTKTVRFGPHNTAARKLAVKLLTAEALDAIAENMERAPNAVALGRPPRVRQLAGALRMVEELHRLGLRVSA